MRFLRVFCSLTLSLSRWARGFFWFCSLLPKSAVLLARVERVCGFSFQKQSFFQRKDLRPSLARASWIIGGSQAFIRFIILRIIVTHFGFLTWTSSAYAHSCQNLLSCSLALNGSAVFLFRSKASSKEKTFALRSLALSYEVVTESVSTVEERFSHNLL